MKERIFWIFLFAVNTLAFAMYMTDKHKKNYGKRRISQALLTTLYLVGGSYGAFMGMLLFNHLWSNKVFSIGVPISLVLWLALIVVIKLFIND